MENCITLQKSECCKWCHICCKKYDKMQKRERIRTYLIITISVAIILCICIIVYFVNIVKELNTRYKDSAQTINNIETEMHKLRDKYDQLEREIHATKLMTFHEDARSYDYDSTKTEGEFNIQETNSMNTRNKRTIRHHNDIQVPLLRQKRAKRRKRCKNCMPAIQIEGSGGLQHSIHKSALNGVWTPASWHTNYPAVRSAFHYSRVGTNGMVAVKKSGLYLLYAQITLTGVRKRGYKLLHRKTDGNEATIAVCKRHLIMDGVSESDSCCTLKVVLLERGDAVFVREEADNTGANYSRSHSYFGLIRLGTL